VIISGGNSKRQPELATFRESVRRQVYHMPIDTRLRVGGQTDRLSLAFNGFTADVDAGVPAGTQLPLRFTVRRKGGADAAYLTIPLVLKPGEPLISGGGRRITPGPTAVSMESKDLGGSIRHRGWTLSWDGAARFSWPVYPYNPYADGPETSLEYAVGTLTFPLDLAGAREATIQLNLEAQ
jgi:hypothetical protein